MAHITYKFEELFNKKFNTKYSIAMNSCTSALECAIKSLGIKGEIIIPSFTWVSTG
jgi:dTDP-4-amino-4,6-dideoxygalactose transaminase